MATRKKTLVTATATVTDERPETVETPETVEIPETVAMTAQEKYFADNHNPELNGHDYFEANGER